MTEQTQGAPSPVIDNDYPSQEAGLFERVPGTRNVAGLLLPKDELSRPNASGNAPVRFGAGSLRIPRDVSVVTLNTEHDRFNPIGRAVSITETDRGWEAEFAIAETDEGDAYLADPSSFRKLSAEVAGLVRDAADKTRATFARLTGAALVKEGAFASAALFSIADDEAMERTATPDEYAELLDEIQAHIEAAKDLTARLSPAEKSEEEEPPAAPAEESTSDDNKEFSMSESNEAGATVPATLLGTAPAAKTSETEPGAVFAAMHAVKNGISGQSADAENLLAALSDIKVNATGGLTTSASGVIQPAWVGKLWQGKRYARRYIDLGNHLYGGIQLGGRKGFTLDQGTALVQHWSGNKSEIPSGTASTGTRASSLLKYAYGADVAREWYDLEGGSDVLQAFFEGVIDSYAELTDEDALKAIFAAATANSTALDKLQAPGTYPTEYAEAMGILIDAIEAVQDANDSPSFAVVNPTAWRQLLFTPKDLVPEFVNFAVNIADGTGMADGKVNVVKAPDSYFVGLNPAEPAVIAGAKNAIEFREQGTTPIQVDALDIAKGGVDKAVIGYLETFVVRPESFVSFGTASV